MNKIANIESPVGRSWSEVRQELFTPEEIAASNFRVALVTEIIKVRRGKD